MFSKRLRRIMYIRGISIAELAKASKIPKASIQNYIDGKVYPRNNIIGVMAIELRVSLDWLKKGIE